MTTLVSWIQLIIIPGGQVTARGCSTMQPTFNKCETHKYGQFKSDKYCYCKETFCNHSSAVLPNIYCLGEQHQPRISPSLGGKRDIIKWNYITLGSCQVVVFITLHKLSKMFFDLLLSCSCSSRMLSVPRHQQLSTDDQTRAKMTEMRDWCEAKILLI